MSYLTLEDAVFFSFDSTGTVTPHATGLHLKYSEDKTDQMNETSVLLSCSNKTVTFNLLI